VTIYSDVFAALDAAEVRYVVVGGMAVLLHGRVRNTVDLDLVIDLAAEPARRAMEALTGWVSGRARRLTRQTLPMRASDVTGSRTSTCKSSRSSTPSDPLREIDVFVDYPVDLEELVRDAATVEVDGKPLHIASVRHLIQMKVASGRPRDLEDVDMLKEILADD
jgi:hypothetical protein